MMCTAHIAQDTTGRACFIVIELEMVIRPYFNRAICQTEITNQ